ncbi:putative tail protein [Pectobacterium phage DU_PP_V]|uniref:Putative tail protein n=1 Tax=Pectobacterium phage DU_PP_V TaxID=2041492 RepID=A0A2D2W730_9CAUD|nr:tail protein [Pectobacterium phage DU_PP_V]ATS94106.1 putative tail protein [Pectobacterium phage DU_PP_V]
MINYTAIKEIFGETLPEAHIFFATIAVHPYVKSYQALRRELGMTTAHTNRAVWKRFVKEYSGAGSVGMSITRVTTVAPRHNAVARYKVTGAQGAVTVTTNAPSVVVVDKSAVGAGLWDVFMDGVTGDNVIITFATSTETKYEDVTLLPYVQATSVVAVPNSIAASSTPIDTTIQLIVTPAEARYNITSVPDDSTERLLMDYVSGRLTGYTSGAGVLPFKDRIEVETTIGNLTITE